MLKHVAPNFSPLFDRLKVRLEHTQTRNLVAVGAYSQIVFGVFDCGSFVPKYWNQLFALYRWGFVHGITVVAEASNIGANAFSFALGETNSTDSPTLTMAKLTQTPRTLWKQCIPAGNHSVVTHRKSVNGETQVGHKCAQDVNFWTQVSSPPSVAYLPQLALAWEPTTLAAPFTAIVTVKYYLDVEFFTLNPQ